MTSLTIITFFLLVASYAANLFTWFGLLMHIGVEVRLFSSCILLMVSASLSRLIRQLPSRANPHLSGMFLSSSSSSSPLSSSSLQLQPSSHARRFSTMSMWSGATCQPAVRRNPSIYKHMSLVMKSSSGKLPDVHIPVEKLEFNYARSSGPGGQNVNKLNTKAEIRFNINEADWIPDEVKVRLKDTQEKNINKVGILYISSQEHRTQKQNKLECVEKLREMVAFAYLEPKERKMYEVGSYISIFLSFIRLYRCRSDPPCTPI